MIYNYSSPTVGYTRIHVSSNQELKFYIPSNIKNPMPRAEIRVVDWEDRKLLENMYSYIKEFSPLIGRGYTIKPIKVPVVVFIFPFFSERTCEDLYKRLVEMDGDE